MPISNFSTYKVLLAHRLCPVYTQPTADSAHDAKVKWLLDALCVGCRAKYIHYPDLYGICLPSRDPKQCLPYRRCSIYGKLTTEYLNGSDWCGWWRGSLGSTKNKQLEKSEHLYLGWWYCTNIAFLVLVTHSVFGRCYRWGRLGEADEKLSVLSLQFLANLKTVSKVSKLWWK